jgi:hypothetical protein
MHKQSAARTSISRGGKKGPKAKGTKQDLPGIPDFAHLMFAAAANIHDTLF